jgi:hypothetical protein
MLTSLPSSWLITLSSLNKKVLWKSSGSLQNGNETRRAQFGTGAKIKDAVEVGSGSCILTPEIVLVLRGHLQLE